MAANDPHRFFLQAIDADHGCAMLEAAFNVADVDELLALLNLGKEHKNNILSGVYEISVTELEAISKRFGVMFDPGCRKIQLNSWHSIRAAPYLIHTNYELMLLLEGRKKFARMEEAYPPERHHNEDYFERYVSEGLLHREVSIEPFPKPITTKVGHVFEGYRIVYYTLKGEEWRIPASKLIWAASRKTGWNESFERLEGLLFGYTEWQMDWWIAQYRERRDALNNGNDKRTAIDDLV